MKRVPPLFAPKVSVTQTENGVPVGSAESRLFPYVSSLTFELFGWTPQWGSVLYEGLNLVLVTPFKPQPDETA